MKIAQAAFIDVRYKDRSVIDITVCYGFQEKKKIFRPHFKTNENSTEMVLKEISCGSADSPLA